MEQETTAVVTTLNHVGMSLPIDVLDSDCDDVLAFYGDLFGWTGYRDTAAEGSPLIMVLGEGPQFVFIYGQTQATGARPRDHFGVAVNTEADLDLILEQARRLQAGDPRVEIIDKDVTNAGEVDVVHCYIRFLLPLMVEIQFFRRMAGTRAELPVLTPPRS
jgi:predicted enzyme related to lactoylglutathione lyase